MEDFSRVVGENLKKYRQKKGWSQLELMAKSGVSQGTITAVENGRPIMLENFVKLALTLEAPLEKILPEGSIFLEPSSRLISMSDIGKDEFKAVETLLDSRAIFLLEMLIPFKNMINVLTDEKKQALKDLVNSILDDDQLKAN